MSGMPPSTPSHLSQLVYKGIAYRQNAGPVARWIVSLVVPAEELLQWAGIPRRSEENMAGFQRTADPIRMQKAKTFFSMPENSSPTALVVGIHPVANGCPPVIELKFESGDANDTIREAVLVVNLDRIPGDVSNAAESIRDNLEGRLRGSGEEVALENEDVVEAQEDSDESRGEDDAIVLGHSVLGKLMTKLQDPEWCKRNAEDLLDLAKPATVIDGQHRVKGAEMCERSIPFAVCAIYDCVWLEQVFQFTVINYTQQGIPDQFITANAALSLTEGELTNLQPRLIQAGVKVIEYELMKVVHFDVKSPFYLLVDLSEKKLKDRIGYKTMVQVAKMWYNASHDVFQLVLPNLYPNVTGKRVKATRMELWRRQDWGDFFLEFWRVVYSVYGQKLAHDKEHRLWDVGFSQLVVAVVLLELQLCFLDNLNAQDESYFSVEDEMFPKEVLLRKVAARAAKFCEFLPVEFFAGKWGISSLNTGAGRKALHDALSQLVSSKGKYQYGKSALVTGEIV